MFFLFTTKKSPFNLKICIQHTADVYSKEKYSFNFWAHFMLNMTQLEQKMKDPAFRWFANIFLIFIIYYTAELSRLLGNEGTPLAISIAWPATGFSLAALLLFGYRLWPGIFLGNFCYNLLYLYLHTHSCRATCHGNYYFTRITLSGASWRLYYETLFFLQLFPDDQRYYYIFASSRVYHLFDCELF